MSKKKHVASKGKKKKKAAARKIHHAKKTKKKNRSSKKKASVKKKLKAEKKTVAKTRPDKKKKISAELVKEVTIDWSKMDTEKRVYLELRKQMNLSKADLAYASDLSNVASYVSEKLNTTFVPYRFVNINVSLVKTGMRDTRDNVIDRVMRSNVVRHPGTEMFIYERDPEPVNHLIPETADAGRDEFISSIASGHWPVRGDLPEPGPARNNELYRINQIHRSAVEYFVNTCVSPEELHLFVKKYNWELGYQCLVEIAGNPVCDLNTALLVFWLCRANYFQTAYASRPSKKEYFGLHQEAWDIAHTIMKNVVAGKYKTAVMPEDFRNELVLVPAAQQLWKIDPLMYGKVSKIKGKKSKGKRSKATRKKSITRKGVSANKNVETHFWLSSKTQVQIHRDILENNTSSKTQYFAGNEFSFEDTPESYAGLEAHHISQEVACSLDTCTALYFDTKNTLVEIREYHKERRWAGDGYSAGLHEIVASGGCKYVNYKLNIPCEFVPTKSGKNHIGGKPPEGFVIPKTTAGNLFQYFGRLHHKDALFGLDHDFHLVYPLYSDFNVKIWLDYQNPMAPEVINHEEVTDLYIDKDRFSNEKVCFDKIPFKTVPWPKKARHGGHSGVPLWIQFPEVPACPKTKKPMRLICQLGDGDLSTKELKNTVMPEKPVRRDGFSSKDVMDNLTSDLDLYVFYSKEAQVACYLAQGT